MNRVIVDSNVIIAEYDKSDSLHKEAVNMRKILESFEVELVYLDCVINEVFSVISKRMVEKKRFAGIQAKIKEIKADFPFETITRAYPILDKYYNEVVYGMVDTNGKLNFHDSLIKRFAELCNIEFILSFDQDFDELKELTRLYDEDSIKNFLA